MSNPQHTQKIQQEVLDFINSRKSLQIASLMADGETPYASYAPFALDQTCLYVLISEIAIHAINLATHPKASVMIIEDEDSAKELFARKRVSYQVSATHIAPDQAEWEHGINLLTHRHGQRIGNLSQLTDFKLFRLTPEAGRYVKGFGRAFTLSGETLAGELVDHLRDGHKKRAS